MSIFSVSVSLTGPPQLQYGFWYSHDSTQTRGHMLTLSNFVATYLSLALGLLVGFAVSRLWRIGCVVLFYFSNVPEPSWEESQNNVFIVTTKTAIDGFIDSFRILSRRAKAYRDGGGGYSSPLGDTNEPSRYHRARYVVLWTMFVASTAILLSLAAPVLIALVPLTRFGIVVPRSCSHVGLPPRDVNSELTGETFVGQARWANAAFAAIDRGGDLTVDAIGSPHAIEPIKLPELKKSFINSCPPNVTPCSPEHPFTFSSQYTLSAQHFSLNVETPFLLHVFDTCYRPGPAISLLSPAELAAYPYLPLPPNATLYGLYYGPVVLKEGTQNFTLIFDDTQAKAGSYTIVRANARANESYPYGWFPNSTLVQGGDTTLLLYYIGGVQMANHSSVDPMFATGEVVNSSALPLYFSEKQAIPIICDTKYVFCDVNKGGYNCSNPGGSLTMLSWLEDRKSTTWTDIQSLLRTSLITPPIHVAASGSTAPLAAQSADGGIQYAPGNITAFGELSRLSKAGMVMLASYAQISATGYWNKVPQAVPFTTEANPDSICNRVIMESSAVTTISVIPYLLFVVFSLLIVAISYSTSLRISKNLFFASFDRLSNIWALHLPGQLHREATETIQGRGFELVSLVDKWPNAPHQSGLAIISGPTILTRKGAERFGSGTMGSAENKPSMEGHH